MDYIIISHFSKCALEKKIFFCTTVVISQNNLIDSATPVYKNKAKRRGLFNVLIKYTCTYHDFVPFLNLRRSILIICIHSDFLCGFIIFIILIPPRISSLLHDDDDDDDLHG